MIIALAASDARLRARLAQLLASHGHRVLELPTPDTSPDAVAAASPHLLVVAGEGAAALVRALRARPQLRSLPVLCVEPTAAAVGAVALLDAGADDAITRPFQPPIFLARVRTLLRRAVWAGEVPEELVTTLTGGPIELRLIARAALVAGRPVELTRLEFDLLAQLLRHPERAFRREELLASVWNYPEGVETRTLDKHVESLRRKIASCAELIQTVHGVGYRFSPGGLSP